MSNIHNVLFCNFRPVSRTCVFRDNRPCLRLGAYWLRVSAIQRWWARPERPERRTGSSHSCCAHGVQRAFSASTLEHCARHIFAYRRLLSTRRTVSRPQEWDERPTNKIPVLKVFGLRINSLRKYSVRWTCPNLSMSKADTVSQVFTTQK